MKKDICLACNGHGFIVVEEETAIGIPAGRQVECQRCQGTGKGEPVQVFPTEGGTL